MGENMKKEENTRCEGKRKAEVKYLKEQYQAQYNEAIKTADELFKAAKARIEKGRDDAKNQALKQYNGMNKNAVEVSNKNKKNVEDEYKKSPNTEFEVVDRTEQ